MNRNRPLVAGVIALVLSINLSNRGHAEDAPKVKLEPIYTNLTIERPVSLVIPPDGTGRRFLVEQTGQIKILPEDESGSEAQVFLEFSDRQPLAEKDFEEGLLGLAFHPDFATNRKFYVTYSQQGPKRTVVSEFQASESDPSKADLSTERIFMEIQQPEWNHNSGNLFFGPDGFLYICVGDGGLKNGVFQLPQKLTRWNGKVLRIDVNSRSEGREYGIPADNPFVDLPLACPEIYAYGLRNPWGASIDTETGVFYLADVGQDLYEEINVIQNGGNYGWEFREGFHEFLGRAALMEALGRKNDVPKGVAFIDPIHEYDRSQGLSITGGFVYRGQAIPALKGCFLYGDWKLGTLWALRYDPAAEKVTANHVLHKDEDLSNITVQPTAFCPDNQGEPLVLGWTGKIFRLVPAE